jgi:large subunit ribosomal protein L22
MLEVKATSKYLRTSAQKAGLVLQLIRGKKASDALSILRFTKKSVARDVEKTLRSAIANAVNVADKNQKRRLDEDDLVVSAAYADQGPTQKRVRPAPMGRAYQVLKRTTHVTVCVAEQEAGTAASAAAKTPTRARARQSKQESK